MKTKNQFALACFILFLAVAIGAFGAHALKDIVTGKYLITFKTGGQYHFYHGLALLMTATFNKLWGNLFLKSYYFFLAGIILFSFNCYLYGITHLKVFAMIIPLGGISFLIAWALMTFTFLKKDLK